MALTAGTRLGPYEVFLLLGAGGMGEVYRARDTKLRRDVALKVLPEAFAKDVARMARFRREAQVLASLNHPNIATIYGLEESNGTCALVMELVEGPTLADRITGTQSLTRPAFGGPPSPLGRGKIKQKADSPSPSARGWSRSAGPGKGPALAIPLDEALPIAKQFAEGLEYAHERGVIHRDLKPANVKVRPDGVVKILDFGLAKALEETPAATGSVANSPTISAAPTREGMILGTAAYMSPEQARGKMVDRRCDIWSFGALLFEMLSGRPAFVGEDVSQTLATVIMKEPEWEALPTSTPPRIRQLLRRCLTKDPKQRLQAIGEARITIEEALSVAPKTGPDVGAVHDASMLLSVPELGRAEPLRQPSVGRRAANWAAAAILLCLTGVGGMWFESRRVMPPPRWSGDLLGGSRVALGPHVSPDGHTLAFLAMVDNLTQVAVLNPDSGNWAVLTHDRSHGFVGEIAWSGDSSKLYFDRIGPPPEGGIYTVPSLGGEERPVLEDAESPVVLPDGSLLVTRLDPDRRMQIYHYWPDSGRLQALGLWAAPVTMQLPASRVFRDGKEAVAFGTVSGNGSEGSPRLYMLDIATGKPRPLIPQLPLTQPPLAMAFPLAVTPDDRAVLIDFPSGNLHQLVAIPRSGSGPVRSLLALTETPWWMDMGPDGSLYLDQVNRPLELLRFPVSGGTPEVVAVSESVPPAPGFMQPVELPDGRFLLPALLSGQARLLVGKPGGNFFPLVDTAEQTGPPGALLPANEVAFIAGAGSDQTIVIASAREGRIIRRLQGATGKQVTSLAASADGKTLYYTASGSVWAIPTVDGTPRKICAGDGVAIDPNGQDLIASVNEKTGVRLSRVPFSGGPGHDIRVQSDPPVSFIPLGGFAVRKDGKILVPVQGVESWFIELAILDPATGKLARVPLNYTGDLFTAAWANDGRILAFGEPIRAHIWRFRPVR